MNKKLNIIMLVMIFAQYLVPTGFVASEVTSYVSEASSEVSNETDSDSTSENSMNEDTSEQTSDISEVTREESEIADSEVADSEVVDSEVSSEKVLSEETDSESSGINADDSLTEAQIADIAKSLKPEVRETVLPNVEYNVLNMDAPAGYYVPEESIINGYSNGHTKVSAPNGKTKNVTSSGYVENISNDPGTLQPDGTISRNTCGVGDDLARFECESILFPVDTNIGGGQGSNYLGNESGIHSSDKIVINYPEALDINGRLFDVKSTYSNFVKTSDSQGGDEGGWYTTFAVSHYFYDGYWLVDFQSVQQELQITDSETGEPLNLSEMKVYDFRFGMQSLNASSSDVSGEYTAEALQPYFGIDETTAVPTCDIENKYNYTLDAVAWEGTSDSECNGVSFNTTNTDTIEFRVAKNPSQADSWGNKYWEIAWFVPIFWATSLPTNYTDAGDAPASYGNGEIQLDGETSIVDDGYGNETVDVIRDDQFYLGDSNPLNDMQNDNYGHTNAQNDDQNPTGVDNYDDETSLDAYLDEGSDVITFKPDESTIDLEIPYTNEAGYDGQIVVWIDFDDNGNFDQDEATVVPISGGSGVANVTVNIPDDAKNCDTYMRVVMNSRSLDDDGNPMGELEDITDKGNAAVYPGLGETEDYGIRLKSDSLISKSVSDENGDDSVSLGETLTYTITVTNTSSSIPVTNVEVKDSLLQNIPDWIRFNNDVEVNPDVPYSGSLTSGDFVIHEIPAGESVDITFSIELVTLPDGITEIENVVTDNGEDPTTPDFICDEADKGIDCDNTITPIIGATTIEKAITNETGIEDGIAEYGEDITYQIKVTNPTSSTANNVAVRDSLLENMPTWMTLVTEPTVDPVGTGTTGSLQTKDFVINTINAGQTITITYTVRISDIPTDVTDVTNIATDNGEDPTTVDPETCTPEGASEDCAIATLPPETIITKTVKDSDGDNKLSVGEQATYTITVTNPASTDATDVNVRDSVYEAISNGSLDFVSIVSTPTLSPTLEFAGDMADGSFEITNLPANSSVEISFVISYDSAPSASDDITSLINIATDNGQDPSEITDPETECPETDDDCATAEIPLLGDTEIAKEITAESNTPADGIVEKGEEVTYKITITNSTGVDAINVPVRDSILEVVNTTDWLTLKGDTIAITPDTTITSGDITNGNFVIETVPAESSITLEYTLIFGDYPKDVEFVENWATDTDQDPTECTEEGKDCAEAIIDTNAPTEIDKALIDESLDVNGIFEDGEDLTYQITITNSTDRDAINVNVRDNLLENLPDYFTWDGNVIVEPDTIGYDGDLGLGTFVLDSVPANSSVTITYTIDGGTLPENVTLVANIVTDNGSDPIFPCLPTSDECALVVNPTEPETLIKKSVKDSNGDKLAQVGETLTFTIEVQNPTNVDAPNTIVRDSLLESLPTYLTFNNDVVVKDDEGNTLTLDPGDLSGDYSGTLTDGNGIDIFDIPGHSSVFITYSVTVNEIPNDIESIINIVTDDESNPTECTEISLDCAGTETPVDPETVIEKTTNLADGEAVAIGDQIEYSITVTNPNTEVPALNVNVQDSLVQNMPPYLKLVSGTIDPTDTAYSGLLSSGNITIASIGAGEEVTITYVVEVTDIPTDVESIINIATDDGTDPNTITPEVCTTDSEDCATTTTPVDPETLISKSAVDSEGNEFNSTNPVQKGEDVFYTISVTNPGSNSALDVNVIDTLVDQITPSLLARILGTDSNFTYNDDMVLTLDGTSLVNPDDYTGDLADADLVINAIPAGKTVEITFSIHVKSLDGISEITNVVTDNGEEVEACTDLSADDCDSVTIPTNPETEIEKSVTESVADGYASVGEELTYSIDVTNSSDLTALNVVVKDSLLSNMPAYLVQVGTVTVDPIGTVVSGDLTSTDGLTISEIPAGETVTISYTLKLISNPDDGEVSLINLATDDDSDITTITPEICTTNEEDCDSTELPVDSDTVIRKDLITQSGKDDGSIENGELLTYQISVNNPGSSSAIDVQVIDSLLPALPTWLTLEGDVVVSPDTIEYSGDLTTESGITINEIGAGETVTITYNLRVGTIPTDAESVINLVSDNGKGPDTISPELCIPGSDLAAGEFAEDCSSTVNPIHPETVISKTVDTGDDEFISVGEEVFYTITITNPSIVDATDVNVRDNLYSNLPSYLEISTPFTVDDDILLSNVGVTGDLINPEGIIIDEIPAGKTVTVTYGLTLTSVPVTGDGLVKNIATDDGSDPETCTEVSDDCSGTITPMDAETTITKKLVSEDGELEGLAESGETLTFEIDIRNITASPAELVLVRDSLVETAAATDWITYNGIIATNPAVLATTGNLEDGTYTISEVLPHSTVKIFYTITLDDIPSDVSEVANIATDNGDDPTDPELICDDNPKDCDSVVVPVTPDTTITKAADAGADEVISVGEQVDYTITVTNPGVTTALDVEVRDSLLENMPSYAHLVTDSINISMNGTELVLDTDYTGDLQDAGIVINSIPAGATVTITYSIVLDSVPVDGVVNLPNVATDNGQDPNVIDPEICNPTVETEDDCGAVVLPLDPDTVIEKTLVDDSIDHDGVAQDGEELTYSLTITNPTDAIATDVEVKDSLLEAMPSWISLKGAIALSATPTYTIETEGSLQTGDFVISQIPANTTVTITYTIVIDVIPSDLTNIPNVATDDGTDVIDPDTNLPITCPEDSSDDCSEWVIPTNPETTIEKTILSESGLTDGIAEIGEEITYQITVSNIDEDLPAQDVIVQDSLASEILNGGAASTYLSIKTGSLTVNGSLYSLDGDILTLDEVAASDQVVITYVIVVNEIPDGVSEVANIATDNGLDPELCDDTTTDDCSEVVIPTNPDTLIEKSVVDGFEGDYGYDDNLAQEGEVLTFTLKVTNSTDRDTASVPVKDSLVEGVSLTPSLYPGIIFNDDVEITGYDYTATASGSLTDGTYVINGIPANSYAEITYSVTVEDIEDNVAEILNIATDNGQDPLDPDFVCDENPTDCDSTITPVDPDTVITKEVTDGADELVQSGDQITYTITVSNPNTVVAANDVVVRDSILENLSDYPYLTLVSEEITPTELNDVATGSLTTDGGITFSQIPAGASATITVVLTVSEVPTDISEILNVVTDDGSDPIDPDTNLPIICEEDSEDCDTATIPVEPDTVIKKEVSNETGSEDGVIENGETIEYTISVKNPGSNTAYDTPVRDSLVENLPAYASYDGNLVLTVGGTELVLDTDYTGDLSSKDLVINEIAAGETVEITYSITFDVIPNDVSEIGNLAVDTDVDPTDPEIVDPELCDQTGAFADDCSEVVVPVHPETIVTKTADAGEDNLVQEGEEVLYTITIDNPSVVDAKDVQVIDSLLAALPDYMELTTPIVISDGTNNLVLDTDYTGDLMSAEGIIINTITAGSTITITYGLTLNDVPESGVIDIANIVTDNGEGITDPELCEDDSEDCSEVVIPVDPDTIIEKAITDETVVDGQAQEGEEITYTITVTNPTDAIAIDVEVKDSILANLPDYLTLVGDIEVAPDTIETTGDLTTDDFVITSLPANSSVTITYTLLVGDVPSKLTEIANIATDNGQDPTTVDPEVCLPNDETAEDCGAAVIDTNPETEIDKSVVDGFEGEAGYDNGIADPSETLTYTISVTNTSDELAALDVPVRDSLLENLTADSGYSFDGNVTVSPSGIETEGDLTAGTYKILSIPAGATVEITYQIVMDSETTGDNKFVANLVTDNGDDPVGICLPTNKDCAQTITPTEPDTVISKTVEDADKNGYANEGEILTYTVKIENPTNVAADNIIFRDSLVESILDGSNTYLQLVDIAVEPDSGYDQYQPDGYDYPIGYVFDEILPKEYYTITYRVRVLDIPDDVSEITNIVTDDGSNPELCDEISTDCAGTITPVEPETIIKKSVEDENKDGAVQTGEKLTYKIDVTNTNETQSAYDVLVRDSILENLPDYMTLVSETYDPSELESTGELSTGGITFTEIPADSTVTITIEVTVDEIPDSLDEILNIATDDGTDPTTVDPETCLPEDETAEDCGTAVIPVDPETKIVKSVTDSNDDGTVEDNDTLTYTIDVTNPGSNTALDVEVKDSLVEEITAGKYDWLTYGADLAITIDGTDLVLNTDYAGDLSSSDLVINEIPAGATATITFTINVGIIPDDVTEIANVVTDNGDEVIDPDTNLPIICPEDSEDCDDATLPTNPNTVISKEVTVSGEDQIASIGDDLIFTIAVQNTDDIDALNVPVKDSLLPTLPNAYAELSGSISIMIGTDELLVDEDYTGDLQTTDGIVINNIPAGETAVITYTITMIDVPTDLETVINIATDDGTDPETLTPETCEEDAEDCASTITPVDPETLIEKEIIAQTGSDDNYFEENETVSYQITVTNPGANTAVLVEVRDSLVEAIEAGDYSYLSVSNIVIADSTGTTLVSGDNFDGTLQAGNLVINAIEAGDYITITYDVTSTEFPTDTIEVGNLVTDNGEDPTEPELCDEDSEDCSEVVLPIEPETTIEKSLYSESVEPADGIAEIGEEITFKLAVTNNNTEVSAHDVAVRDSLVEQIVDGGAVADYIENVGFTVEPEGTEYTGTLEGKDLVIAEIEAGSTVNVYVTFKITDVPEGVFTFENIASDNGLDPTEPETCEDEEDCSEVVIPLDGDTTIEKNVMSTESTYYPGDVIDYQLIVSNDTVNTAYNVPVRDSLLENTPDYVKYNGDIMVKGAESSGNITKGTFSLDEVPANSKVYITYSLTLKSDPEEESLLNVATDDGQDPSTVDPETIDPDNKGKGDKDDAIVEVGSKEDDPTPDETNKDDYTDMTLGQTGGHTMFILIDLVLILIVSMILRKRMS